MKFYMVAVEDEHGCFFDGPEALGAGNSALAREEGKRHWEHMTLHKGHRVVLYECREIAVVREGSEEEV